MLKNTAIANILDRANYKIATSQDTHENSHQKRATAVATTSGFDAVSDSVCRVRIEMKNCDWGNKKDMLLAVANTLGDGVIPVIGSFQRINPKDNIVVGLVTRGIATQSLSETDFQSRFTQVAKNVLMDNEDQSVWDLVSSKDGGVVLARQVDEDLSTLVAMARTRNMDNKLSHDVESMQPVTAGYARFYNPTIKGIDHGYLCGAEEDGTLIAVSRTLNDLVEVDARLLVACANIHVDANEYEIHAQLHRGGVECPAHLIKAMQSQRANANPFARNKAIALVTETEQPLNPESVSYENMREYYKQMYAYAPEYFADFEKMISESGF